jgi:pimeloyl-ACP methyl ester carboxylesterase
VIDERIDKFILRESAGISYRESGLGPALVMLHGIGSSSAGWLFQLESIERFRVIAWDAPGYGRSQPLAESEPRAADYARSLARFLDSLELRDALLVANSLGGLIAGAFARAHPERVRSLFLISPAGGHRGDKAKLAERLRQLDELGPEGLAEKRSPTLVAARSPAIALELVRWSQRRIHPSGYRQAAHCLAYGALGDDARHFAKPVRVVCGTEDTITPEASCKAIARAFQKGEYCSLPGVGHCAQIEDPTTINAMLSEFAT